MCNDIAHRWYISKCGVVCEMKTSDGNRNSRISLLQTHKVQVTGLVAVKIRRLTAQVKVRAKTETEFKRESRYANKSLLGTRLVHYRCMRTSLQKPSLIVATVGNSSEVHGALIRYCES
jgi:hypothetical protein